MPAIGVMSLTFADVNLFAEPPRRPARRSRRRRSSRRARLTRAVGRFITEAIQDENATLPQLRRYPY
jgi:hypothetical protein